MSNKLCRKLFFISATCTLLNIIAFRGLVDRLMQWPNIIELIRAICAIISTIVLICCGFRIAVYMDKHEIGFTNKGAKQNRAGGSDNE